MARGKSKKGAAVEFGKLEEKLGRVGTPEQQRKAGEFTAGMLGGGAAGFVGKQIGKQIVKKIVTRTADKKAAKAAAKKTVKKKTEIEAKKNRESFEKRAKPTDKELSDFYKNKHPRMRKTPAKVSKNVLSNEKLLELYKKSHPRTSKLPAKKPTDKELSDLYKKSHPRTRGKKAKGGSVNKYARGGGVRKART